MPMKFNRPRVIRGTQESPLPLLPSGSGGVRSYPLHEARSLSIHGSILGLVEVLFCALNWVDRVPRNLLRGVRNSDAHQSLVSMPNDSILFL